MLPIYLALELDIDTNNKYALLLFEHIETDKDDPHHPNQRQEKYILISVK